MNIFFKKPFLIADIGVNYYDIAQKEEITYEELKAEYCEPTPKGVVSGRNVMFDSDLKVLESEGYITITDDLIKYIKRA